VSRSIGDLVLVEARRIEQRRIQQREAEQAELQRRQQAMYLQRMREETEREEIRREIEREEAEVNARALEVERRKLAEREQFDKDFIAVASVINARNSFPSSGDWCVCTDNFCSSVANILKKSKQKENLTEDEMKVFAQYLVLLNCSGMENLDTLKEYMKREYPKQRSGYFRSLLKDSNPTLKLFADYL